jgi:hypothetical protein
VVGPSCPGAASGGAAGGAAAAGRCGRAGAGGGACTAGGAADAGGAGATAGGAGGGAGRAGGSAAGAAGATCGGATGAAGRGGTAAGAAGRGGATGIAGFAAGGGDGGAAGRGGTAAGCVCWLIAFSTSPGREIFDRSILVLISGSPYELLRLSLARAASCCPAKNLRTRSASSTSMELEWVFFSVTPTFGKDSRISRLLTSSSRARSLIRIFIRVVYSLRSSTPSSQLRP